MDPASLAGIAIALVVIVVANILEGGNTGALFLMPPMLLVFGGTLATCVACGTMTDAKNVIGSLKKAFVEPVPDSRQVVTTMVSLGDTARREGLLALETRIAEIDDPFLARGLQLAVDGTDPEDVQDILYAEIDAVRADSKQRAKFFADAGGFAPTIGIVGTVMSLVHVLENLSEPEALGHSISSAFLATLWGVLSANVIWLPISNRIKRLGEIETSRMEAIATGIAAIQAGSNPRIIEQRLSALLPGKPEAA